MEVKINMEMISNFSKRLREFMEDNNYTFDIISKITDIPAQTLNRYTLGQRVPKIDQATEIALKIQVNPLWLQGFNVPRQLSSASDFSEIKDSKNIHQVPILGSIRAGYGKTAYQDILGYLATDSAEYETSYWLKVEGCSMEPRIFEGDYILIDKEAQIENGDIVAAIVDGEDGTIKKFDKQTNYIMLRPLNPSCETRVFVGTEQKEVFIVGKVTEIRAKL